MKSKIIVFLVLILFTMPKITAFSQNRNVYWVHGFTGSAVEWQHYATLFANERKINSIRPTYKSTSGLTKAAQDLENSVSNSSANMGIGHSMGGVTIREVEKRNGSNTKFGGYITISAPNYGAPISDNVLNQEANKVIATGLKKLASGPIAEFGPKIAPVWKIFEDWTTKMVTDALLNVSDFTSQATNNDLKVGGQRMNELNNFNSTSHRISIITEETSPVHWRIVGSMKIGAGSSGNPGDQQMVTAINEIRWIYNHMYQKAWAIGFLGKAKEWKKGRDWLDNSETIWCSLIKSSISEPRLVATGYWKEVPCGPFPPPRGDKPPDYPYDPDNPFIPGKCYEWVHTGYQTVYVTVNYKNDGLLPTYCQELKGVEAPSNNRYVIDHANHMEVKNMTYSKNKNGQVNDGTRNTLNTIFDGKDQYDWFKTPRK